MSIKIIDDDILFIAENHLFKLNIETRTFISNKIFNKNCKNKSLIVVDSFIYIHNTSDIYKISLETLSILNQYKIGNLNSNIIKISNDEENVYVVEESGSIFVLDKKEDKFKNFQICNCRISDFVVGNYIYASNVDTELLIIEKSNFNVIKTIKLHNTNIGNIFSHNNLLYTASFDLSITVLDLNTYNIIHTKKNIHQRMFTIVGIYNDYLITTSKLENKTKIWNKNDFILVKTLNFSSENMIISGDYLYFEEEKEIRYLNLLSSTKNNFENYEEEITNININGEIKGEYK